jgi:hypothetical protein
MKIELDLTLDQQFKLKVFLEQSKLLSAEEAQIFILHKVQDGNDAPKHDQR